MDDLTPAQRTATLRQIGSDLGCAANGNFPPHIRGKALGRIAVHILETADYIEALETENARLRSLVQCLLDNDPGDLAADGGVTVLDVWRKDARAVLAALEEQG